MKQQIPDTLDGAKIQQQLRQALKRFVRNKNVPEEMETLRHNLIVARILQGYTAVEAAELFGYKNSTQISLIESGDRPVPKDHKFLRQAAEIYKVSCDFLLGLSPHTDIDHRVSQQYQMMRGTEAIMGGIAAQFTTAMVQFTNQTQPTKQEYERVCDAIARIEETINVMRAKNDFDDMLAGAPVLRAVKQAVEVMTPLREKVRKMMAIEDYFTEMREGRMQPIPYLLERYSQTELPLEG